MCVCGQSAEWCGPDGSVVLIRAVRSGLDRVVLELLRAGVPVNNTDHTGESWSRGFCLETSAGLALRMGSMNDGLVNKVTVQTTFF